jgi:PAS domain S-box-containing protein
LVVFSKKEGFSIGNPFVAAFAFSPRMASPNPAVPRLSGFPEEMVAGLLPMELLFDELGDVVFFVKDVDGRYSLVNQTLADRCGGGNKGELIGRKPGGVFAEELSRHYEAQDLVVLRTGRPVLRQLELHLYPRGGTGWCLTSKWPLRDTQGRTCGLIGISRDLNAPSRRSRGYAELAAALDDIWKRYPEPLRMEDLARVAGLSLYQFQQRVQKLFQMPPLQLLHKVRVEEAVRLISASDGSLSEIAQAVGYCDQSALNKHFMKFTGITPGRFRTFILSEAVTV